MDIWFFHQRLFNAALQLPSPMCSPPFNAQKQTLCRMVVIVVTSEATCSPGDPFHNERLASKHTPADANELPFSPQSANIWTQTVNYPPTSCTKGQEGKINCDINEILHVLNHQFSLSLLDVYQAKKHWFFDFTLRTRSVSAWIVLLPQR